MIPIVLASASAVRARLLESAGVTVTVDPAGIGEEDVKASLKAEGASASLIADALADLKARQVSMRHPGALVIGADQVLECDGRLFDKPVDLTGAAETLRALQGRSHKLISAVVVSRDRNRIWQHTGEVRLTMRELDDEAIDRYLARAGNEVCRSVGAYQLEGLGVNLFRRVDGDFFTVLGLPLLPLLDFLRVQGALDI